MRIVAHLCLLAVLGLGLIASAHALEHPGHLTDARCDSCVAVRALSGAVPPAHSGLPAPLFRPIVALDPPVESLPVRAPARVCARAPPLSAA